MTLVARRKDKLDALASGLETKTFVFPADLSDVARCCDFVAPAEDALGPIDILVNNAGVQIIEPAHLCDPDHGEDLLRINVHTPMRIIRHVLPAMLARKQGTIVNVASVAALAPVTHMFYYNAAKGALANASEALRGELEATGVNVVTVYPGPVHTDMGDKGIAKYEPSFATRLTVWGTSEGLAKRVGEAIDMRRARVIYPATYALSRWMPNISRWLALRFGPRYKGEEEVVEEEVVEEEVDEEEVDEEPDVEAEKDGTASD